MSNFDQTRSFNVGLATDTSVASALIYDELAFWAERSKTGWVYKNYDDFLERLPFLSEYQVRKAIQQLEDAGFIEKKLKKANGAPTLHFRFLKNLRMDSEKTSESETGVDSEKTSESINSNYKTTTKARVSKMIMTSSGEITVDEFLSRIIVLVNKKEKVTEERTRQLRARLKDYTAVEIWKAAQAFSKSQWHRENGQMSIDNLIRPSKFGRWYAASNDKAASTASDGSAPEAQDRSNYDEEMRKMKEAQAEQAKRNAEFME